MLDVKVDILQCPKDDSIQCEDYFQESKYNKNEDEEYKFYCLCDGASESYDSLLWAKIIANEYIEDKYRNKKINFNPKISSDFVKICSNKFSEKIDFNSLSWSHQSAFLRGSFSTLLAVSFISETRKVGIFAVGDSVAFLYKTREFYRVKSFPYRNVNEFKNKPILLSSNSNLNNFLKNKEDKNEEEWIVENNDIILLMTDAIAEWLMFDKKTRFNNLMKYFNNSKKNEFKKFVSEERSNKSLRIDDTTVVKLEFKEKENELPDP